MGRSAEPALRAYTLGRFEVLVHGRAIPDNAWGRRKSRQLLKCLLTRLSHRITREQAAEWLWPESDPEAAAVNLRSVIFHLRRALNPTGAGDADLVGLDRDTVCLRAEAEVWVDAEAFERAIAEAQRAADPLPHLEEADALYAGDYLADDLYEDWASERREALRRAWTELQFALARQRERSGDPERAAAALHRLLEVDRCDERAAQELMRLLLRQGWRSETLRVYHRLVQALRDELDVEPSAASVELGSQVTAPPPLEPLERPEREPAGAPPAESPSGTVTLLFTDIEGSTQLLQQLADTYGAVLAEHQRLLRAVFQAWGGQEIDTQGDAFFVVFHRASDAAAAVVEAQRALAGQAWPHGGEVRVRMALHTGEPTRAGERYIGLDVHRVARVCAAGYGGQVLVTQTTRDLVEHELPAGVRLRDLGEYHLKDLPRPERLFQLDIPRLARDFPPLKANRLRPHNLPIQRTPLIDRERETAALRQLLRRDDVGLVTLTGPAGTGKTRLALEVAAGLLDHFEDGVYLVALAPIEQPDLVASAIVRVLDLQEGTGRPLGEMLKDYLQDKRLLLVLDNFEHLLAATPLVGELLASCPRLKVLATSRAGLHLYGEQDFPVPPLGLPNLADLPPAEELARYDAVALFVERAVATRPDFTLTASSAPTVTEICARLNGLPLAIELAAARVKLLSPREMLARFREHDSGRLQLLTGGARDLPARHQTLRAAVGWSYDLLDSAERALFRRLAVFVGGFTLQSAEAVAGDHPADSPPGPAAQRAPDLEAYRESPIGAQVMEGVASLVDKSLLQRDDEQVSGETRFVMLETIREYGLEQLAASDELWALRRRHAQYYLAYAEAAEGKLGSAEQAEWFARLEADQPNLRAALTWSLSDEGDPELRLRLAGALWLFWFRRGYLSEGTQWLERVLATTRRGPSAARAKVLVGAGSLARFRSDLARAAVLLEEGTALYREIGDRAGLAWSLSHYGLVVLWLGSGEQGTALLEESLALRRELGDQRDIARSLLNLAAAADFRGDDERALRLLEESLTLYRRLGDTWGHGRALSYLGRAAQVRGEHERAAQLFQEALALSRRAADGWGIPLALVGLGSVAHARGDHQRAAALLEEALTLLRDLGSTYGIVECLRELASVAQTQGRSERATRLFAAAEAARESIGLTAAPAHRTLLEQAVDTLRATLGQQAFASAWAEGRAIPLGDAIAAALEVGAGEASKQD